MQGMTAMPELRGNFQNFKEADAYFRRKLNMPSERWDDLMHAEHASGFMVAGVTRMHVLDDVRKAVEAARTKGETLEDFRKRFAEIISKHGWPGGAGGDSEAGIRWRTNVIYHTNLRTSYMAGRWETLKEFPYLKYQHNSIKNPREEHRAWDGKIIPTNDPWWETHYPPNGWGCRCTVTGVSEARLHAQGKTVPDAAPGPSAGDPPPEWAYHVGRGARSLAAAEAFGKKVMQLPADWRDAVLDDAVKRQVNWLQPQWAGMTDALFEQHLTTKQMLDMQRRSAPVGVLPSRVVRALESGYGASSPAPVGRKVAFVPQTIPSPVIFGGDEFIAHAIQRLPPGEGIAAWKDAIKEIPQWMQAQDAVYLHDDSQRTLTLILAKEAGDGEWWKLVLTRSQRRANRENVTALRLTTLKRVPASELSSYKQLAGSL